MYISSQSAEPFSTFSVLIGKSKTGKINGLISLINKAFSVTCLSHSSSNESVRNCINVTTGAQM